MLTDRRIEQERWARGRRERRKVAGAFGRFIAGLARWDWFVTLTLRDREPQGEEPWERGELRREANVTIYKPDPRLVRYKPSSRFSSASVPQLPEAVLRGIELWLLDVQKLAGLPIGWIIAEEFGRLGGRWHCHILVAGVSGLYRKFCWLEARRRFGYTRIEAFNPSRGAAFYTAKYAGRTLGEIHFGGTLAGKNLSRCEESHSPGGGRDVVVSAPLPKSCFHMCLPRRHR
jgi:hypothetical protein